MILPEVSTWHDAGVVAVAVSAVIAAGYSINRAYKSIRRWVARMIVLAKEAFSDAVDASATGHLVKYHLGPNGKTRAMHERLKNLEEAHAIEQTDP